MLLILVAEQCCFMSEENKKLVENLLRKNRDGLIVSEIASILKMSRNTVAVALAELKGERRIRLREIGMAKLHYLKEGRK